MDDSAIHATAPPVYHIDGASLYRPAGMFAVRLPLRPVDGFLRLSSAGSVPNGSCESHLRSKLTDCLTDDDFRLSLSVASPSLGRDADRWLAGALRPAKERRVATSLYRYYTRSCTRATPFGLFAGIGFGHLSDAAGCLVELHTPVLRKVRIRPDIGWVLCVLESLDAAGLPELGELLVMANPAVQARGSEMLLLPQFEPGKGSYISDKLVTVTRPVRAVLELAEDPVRYRDLIDKMVVMYPDTSREPITRLVSSLLKSSILLSELMPNLLSEMPTDDIADRIVASERLRPVAHSLRRFSAAAREAGENYGVLRSSLKVMADICAEVTPGHKDVAVQCDVEVAVTAALPHAMGRRIAGALDAICRAGALVHESDPLARYHQAFVERYGGAAEVPILDVLNGHTGLGPVPGYACPPRKMVLKSGAGERGNQSAASRPLVNAWLTEALLARAPEIELTDERLAALSSSAGRSGRWPTTLDVTFQVAAASEDAIKAGDYLPVIAANGIARGGRTMGRFADFMTEHDSRLFRDIYSSEERRYRSAAFAEVRYLPTALHYANVAVSPNVRRFEIPFDVHGPAGGEPSQIRLSDLLVRAGEAGLEIRSRSLGCEVIVTQGNMLNPAVAPNVVRFLIDVSAQRCGRVPLGVFQLGAGDYSYFPRLVRDGVVLRAAQWSLLPPMLAQLAARQTDQEFGSAIQAWREKYLVPRYVFATRSDRRLLYDLEDCCSVHDLRIYLTSELRRRSGVRTVLLEEMLPAFDKMWVRDPQGSRYAAEFTMSFTLAPDALKSGPERVSPDAAQLTRERVQPRPGRRSAAAPAVTPPGGRWAYLKIYAAREMHDAIIRELAAFTESGAASRLAIDKWFFLRYADPESHLRIRLRAQDARVSGTLLAESAQWATRLMAANLARDFEFCTYVQEMRRYGGPYAMSAAESLFHLDSAIIAELLCSFAGQPAGLDVRLLAAMSLDEWFGSMGLDGSSRLALARELARGRPELQVGAELRKMAGKMFTLLMDTQDNRSMPTAMVTIRQSVASRKIMTARLWRTFERLDRLHALSLPATVIQMSLAHMHVNRLYGPPSATELDIYGLWAHGLEVAAARRRHDVTKIAGYQS